MRWMVSLVVAVTALTGVIASTISVSGLADDEAAPIFGIKIPAGYRDWKLISVAHEAGDLNDLRAVLGNDVAVAAYRDGKLPFPDGAIIARLAWSYVPAEENNKVFGRAVAARAPDAGEDYAALAKKFSTPASAGIVFDGDEGRLNEEGFLRDFAGDLPEAKRSALFAVQCRFIRPCSPAKAPTRHGGQAKLVRRLHRRSDHQP